MLHLVQPTGAATDMIEQSSGRGDQDVHSAFQFIHLPSVTDTAEHNHHPQIREPRKIPDGRLYLCCQFASRFEYE
jgi:hypothetical protein